MKVTNEHFDDEDIDNAAVYVLVSKFDRDRGVTFRLKCGRTPPFGTLDNEGCITYGQIFRCRRLGRAPIERAVNQPADLTRLPPRKHCALN